MTQDGAGTLTYDAANRVVAAAGVSFVYDGAGVRAKTTWSWGTVVWIRSGTKVLADYWSGAAPTSPIREHFYSAGQWVASHHPEVGVVDLVDPMKTGLLKNCKPK